MERHHLLRRVVHSMTWVVLVYYFIPDEIMGYSKRSLLFMVVVVVLAFEGLRVYKGWHIYGMRHYEKHQIAAYAWAAMAATITLLLFPMHLAFICLLGMGIVDPMIGEINERAQGLYPYLPFGVWTSISLVGFFLFTPFGFWVVVIFSLIGASVALAAEKPTIIIDDDFLMIVVPLFVLRGLELLTL